MARTAGLTHGQYRSLQQLFEYVVAEEIIDANPFDKLSSPHHIRYRRAVG